MIKNYTSVLYWTCNTCKHRAESSAFIYRYTEIAVTPIKLKRISTQHCPKCDSSDIKTSDA